MSRRSQGIATWVLTVGFCMIAASVWALEIVRQKNAATVVVFPMIDSSDDVSLKTGLAASADSEILTFTDSTIGAGWGTDCTNEIVEYGSTGTYSLSLTQSEMNNDYITIKTTATGANPQIILIRTTVADPLLYAATDDGGVINVTTGAVDTVTTTTTATSVTNQVTANVTQISGDTTAADNLELQFDTTGLTGDTFPSTQAQVGNIATTGAAAYQAAASFTATTAGTPVNDYTFTDTSNSSAHQIPDSGGGGSPANTLDVYYEYTLRPDEVGVGVQFKGRMQSSPATGDSFVCQAWNWTSTPAAWVTLFSQNATTGTTDSLQAPSLVGKYTGTGSDIGKVRIRFYGTSLSSTTLHVDQLIVAKASTSRTVGYSQGSIWIDSTNGTAGTTTYFNGTADHPVSTWADAKTLADALGFYRFQVAPGTTIAPAADAKKYAFAGKGWIMTLGGHDYSFSTIEGAESITGTATATESGSEIYFWNDQVGAVTVSEADFHNSHITDTVTLGESSTSYLFNGCSFVPIGTSGVDFASTSNNVVVIGSARGVITIANMSAGDTLYVDGACKLTLAASNTGGTVHISGAVELTNSGSGQTIYQDALVTNTSVASSVWDATAASYTDAGSTGELLNTIDDISAGAGVPVSYAPTSATRTIGDDEGGTYANLAARDDSNMVTGENATTGLSLLVARSSSTTTETPSLVRICGFYGGPQSHQVYIQAYNYDTTAWDTLSTMQNRNSSFDYVVPLNSHYDDDSTGAMQLRFLHSTTTYNASDALTLDFVSWEKVETNNAMASDIAQILSVLGTPLDTTLSRDISNVPAAVDTQLSNTHGPGPWR